VVSGVALDSLQVPTSRSFVGQPVAPREKVPARLVHALSAVAGLVLTPVLLTSRLVPRSLSILGIAGYALLLAGVVCNLLGIADIGWHVSPAGIVFLAPGGLFELLFPLLLIVRGFSAGSRARPVPVRTGSARHRDVTAA